MEKGTSDERLLKLIEGGGAGEPRRKQNIGISPKKSLSELIPAGKFKIDLKAIKEFKFNLASFNRALIALASIVTLILIYSLLSGPVVSASNAAYFTSADVAGVAKSLSLKDDLGLARKTILSRDLKRNIFLPPGAKASASLETNGPSLAEITKDFKLVGIIWGAEPEAMIEYAKDSRTYTLKKGDSFNGDQFRVKDISRSSAILEISADGKVSEYELR